METKDYYIYRWTHIATGRMYIGKGRKNRAFEHPSRARGKIRCRSVFHAALRKHGEAAFSLDFLAAGLSHELAKTLEIAAIAAHGTQVPKGFNITKGGEGLLGVRHTEETRKKQSESAKAWRDSNPLLAAQRDEKAKEQRRSAQSRKKSSDLAKERWARAPLNVWTEERRRSASEMMKKRMMDPEAKALAALGGKKRRAAQHTKVT